MYYSLLFVSFITPLQVAGTFVFTTQSKVKPYIPSRCRYNFNNICPTTNDPKQQQWDKLNMSKDGTTNNNEIQCNEGDGGRRRRRKSFPLWNSVTTRQKKSKNDKDASLTSLSTTTAGSDTYASSSSSTTSSLDIPLSAMFKKETSTEETEVTVPTRRRRENEEDDDDDTDREENDEKSTKTVVKPQELLSQSQQTKQQPPPEPSFQQPVSLCRVVVPSDGKIPTSPSILPPALVTPDNHGRSMLDRVDAIFHATSHAETADLTYLERGERLDRRRQRWRQNSMTEEEETRVGGVVHTNSSSNSSETDEQQVMKVNSTDCGYDLEEEKKLVKTLRASLEDAGFVLLNKRDLDLCEALNAGYLLRLSIQPDVKGLDPCIGREFYPELFPPPPKSENDDDDEKKDTDWKENLPVKKVSEMAAKKKLEQIAKKKEEETLPFGGRVLVFRRGYDEEVTRGRMLLPKIDYLQASLVQRSAAFVTERLGRLERRVGTKAVKGGRYVRRKLKRFYRLCMMEILNIVPSEGELAASVRSALKGKIEGLSYNVSSNSTTLKLDTGYNAAVIEEMLEQEKEKQLFNLDRYGGTRKARSTGLASQSRDALAPFLVCKNPNVCSNNTTPQPKLFREEADQDQNNLQNYQNQSSLEYNLSSNNVGMLITDDEHDINMGLNQGRIVCEYDAEYIVNGESSETHPPMRLLERISVRDLVDLFSTLGRRRIVASFFSKSELVEPTYEEVVLIWRPMPEKIKKKPVYIPPKAVYDVAEIFEVEDRLPQKPEPEPEPQPTPLQIRTFDGVPMANLPAVLPKTKLIFRPADAFVFDLVSVVSFLALLGSLKFDSPKLDLIAIVSGIFWLVRTFFRYSNKLARYDLLVNKFLTSKISHRGAGALKYILTEAGSQRAIRAGLAYQWLLSREQSSGYVGDETGKALSSKQRLIQEGGMEMNDLLRTHEQVLINSEAAMDDLEKLGLIKSSEGIKPVEVVTGQNALDALKKEWNAVFDGTSTPSKGP